MVAADDDGGAYDAACDQVVERKAGDVSFAVAEPAYACRQALSLDLRGSETHPPLQTVVVRERLEDRFVGCGEVGVVARQARPAERTGAAREQWAHVGDDETRIVERVLDPGVLRLTAQAVAVVEDDRAFALELDHRLAVHGHRG